MKSFKHRTSTKRRLLLSMIPTFFCSNVFANTLKKYFRKPIQVVFPIPYAGSINREIPMRMFDSAGLDYYFENKLGASGLIATRFFQEEISNASLMVATNTLLLTNFIQNSEKLGNDFENVFKCVGAMYKVPFVLITKAGGKLDSDLNTFIKNVKHSENPLTCSITGYYDIPHLCGLMLSKATNSNFIEVPYKNSYVLPVITGEVNFSFTTLSAALPFIKSKQLSVIGHTSSHHQNLIPKTESLTKLNGFQSIESVYGLVAKKSMPSDVINELNTLLNGVLIDSEYRQSQLQQGVTLYQPHTSDEYLAYLRGEKQKYESIIRSVKRKIL